MSRRFLVAVAILALTGCTRPWMLDVDAGLSSLASSFVPQLPAR
jgi:hypothetical protein